VTSSVPESHDLLQAVTTGAPKPRALQLEAGAPQPPFGLRLTEWLFPKAIPSIMLRSRILLCYVFGFALLALVPLLRQTGVPAWNSVWAEDGQVFYQQTYFYSIPKALTTLYAGYLQFFPRVVAETARLLPLRDFAPYTAVVGAATLSALCLLVFHASRGHLRSVALRCVLVAGMVLLPLATSELLDNVVNIPWWFFFATFWVLLWRPRTVAGRLIAALCCFFAVASDPLVGLFAPLVVLRMFSLRRFSEHAASAGFVCGLALQGAAILHAHGQSSFSTPSFQGVPKAFLLRVGLGWLTGGRVTSYFITSNPTIGMVLGGVSLVLVGWLVIWRSDLRVRLFATLSLVAIVVTFAIPVWLRGAGQVMATHGISSDSRYAAAPILIIVSVLLVRIDQSITHRNREMSPPRLAASVLGVGLAVALLAPFWVLDFRDSNTRSGGPAWSAQLSSAIKSCKSPSGSRDAMLDFSPPGPVWHLTLPCWRVTGSRSAPVPQHRR
jgi:hypothetical protein